MTETLVPRSCPDCDSDLLTWSQMPHKLTQVGDGRLCLNETTTLFALGCTECSETLLILDAEEIARLMNGERVVPARR